MEIKKVCVVGPEGMGRVVEEKCKGAGIEVSRVGMGGDLRNLKDKDLVIDPSYGDLDAKRKMVREIEAALPEKAIFASNPLLLSLTRIASLFKKRDRVMGLSFPFYRGASPFVEIVVGVETSEETIEEMKRFLEKIGLSCIRSRDSAGLVLNRVLASMINEAIYVYSSGLAPRESIDQMMRLAANFPMGPLEYADEIGLDHILDLLTVLTKELGAKYRPCPLLVRKVEAGHLGKKTGRGFYEYKTE
jgi:3-hydroxybutyryl-CoA dehydrogenase